MSIEGSSTATSTKAPTGAAGHSGKSKPTTGDKADALGAGGFLALMSSLEPEINVVGDDLADASPGGQMQATDAPRLTEASPQLVSLPIAVPLLPIEPGLPNDLSMLLAQAGEVAVDKSSALNDQGATGAKGAVRLDTTAIAPEKLGAALAEPLPGTPLATTAVGPERLGAVLLEPMPGNPLAATAVGPERLGVAPAGSDPLVPDALADLRRCVDAVPGLAVHGMQARPPKARDAELRLKAGAILEESRAFSRVSTTDLVGREPALSGALLASGLGEGLLRQGDRFAGKPAFSAAGSGFEGIWGQQAFPTENRVATSSVVANTATPLLESQVAETVSYWVTQGVKHAELKLDGFGGEPLEVSISLQGGEAHIDFRTDQPEIRQMLEGAAAQLKELLKSEGLVLSGVSVGTSGQYGDAAGAQERRNRSNARQATISTTQAAPTEILPRTAQSTGRTVDLYV